METAEYTKFVINNWYLFVALGVVLALIVLDPLRRMIYRVQLVGPSDVVALINRQNAIVVDVRDPNEFRAGHIGGAINLPMAELGARAKELDKYKGRPIVVTCRVGQTAGKGAVLLRKHGLENVNMLAGGIAAWERAQLPVVR